MVPTLILFGVVVVILFFSYSSADASTGACGVVSCGGITSDVSTWPTGDKVWDTCRAIAIAEGANVSGSNPDRLNNPGDISDGGLTYGFEVHSGSSVTHFPDKPTGWKALYTKIKDAFVDGSSLVYSPDMTWTAFAHKYAGDWQSWLNNVTSQLGVSPDDRVGDYFGT